MNMIDQREFTYLNTTIKLKNGKYLQLSYENDKYNCYWNSRLLAWADTLTELHAQISMALAFMWKEYVENYIEEECTKDAIQLHYDLIEDFESV